MRMRPGCVEVAVLVALATTGCFLFPSVGWLSGRFGRDAGQDGSLDAASEAAARGCPPDGGCPPMDGAAWTSCFCDDFENDIGFSKWGNSPIIATPDGGASLSENDAGPDDAGPTTWSGSRSLHTLEPFNVTNDEAFLRLGIAQLDGALALRAYVRALPTPPYGTAFAIFENRDGGPQRAQIAYMTLEFIGTYGFLQIAEYLNVGDAGPFFTPTSMMPPLPPSWACLEWDTLLGPAGHHNLFIDRMPVLSWDGPTSLDSTIDNYNGVGIGLTHTVGPADLYFDDVVIATFAGLSTLPATPLIGCE